MERQGIIYFLLDVPKILVNSTWKNVQHVSSLRHAKDLLHNDALKT